MALSTMAVDSAGGILVTAQPLGGQQTAQEEGSSSQPGLEPLIQVAADVGYGNAKQELDANLQQLVIKMRKLAEEEDPLSQGTDDASLVRFLRARSNNVEKASKMFVEHQRWRRSFVPLGYISEKAVLTELKANKFCLQGRDKKGRPIVLVQASNHVPADYEVFKRYIVFIFDKTIASLPPGEEKFCSIVNLKGLGYKNIDIRGWIVGFDFLQAYYPERLGKLFIVHPPYIFWGAWKFVCPFIDKATKEKIVFVNDKDIPSLLLEDISEDQLPEILGGQLSLVPIQDVEIPNWPPKATTQNA